MSKVQEALIEAHLKTLKMPGIRGEYSQLARQARSDSWSYENYLRELLDTEISSREDRTAARRLHEARFPDVKVARPIGTGETHLAIGLDVEAARKRFRVLFVKAADLVRQLLEARDDRMLGRLHVRLRRVDLLIVDELGFVPFDRVGGELLFNLIADRYERRSTIVTTNLAFSEWVQVFADEKLTTALLDRLGHHARILTTNGVSYRTARRGETTTATSKAPTKK